MKTLRRHIALTVCAIGFLAASAVSVKAETPAQPQGKSGRRNAWRSQFYGNDPVWSGKDHVSHGRRHHGER
jgi:hypothetical protein